jgi:hypothetical protein
MRAILATLAVAMTVALPLCPTMAQETDMSEMIGSAKTPADHLALAKMYQDEADKDKAQAAKHKKMAAAYAQFTRNNELTAHCQRLANYYKEAANEYSLMATIETDKAREPQAASH